MISATHSPSKTKRKAKKAPEPITPYVPHRTRRKVIGEKPREEIQYPEMPALIPDRRKLTKAATIREAMENPKAIVRNACLNSLFYFFQYFWPEVSNDALVPNWHIPYLCKELELITKRVEKGEDKAYDLLVNVPPGSTKTILISVIYPAWVWARSFWIRFITVSYSNTLSLESAEYSRDLIKSQRFKDLFPELDIKADKDNKGNFKVIKKLQLKRGVPPQIKNGGNRYSTSVGGTLTGFHGHIIIVDDPQNAKKAESDQERVTANTWVDRTLSTRKTNKRVSVTIYVQQRLHQHDVTGHLLKKQKANMRHICLPGQIRNYEEQLTPKALKRFYTPDGLFDPIRMPWSVLKEMEADLGQYGFSGQVGQKPTPPGGGMFKVSQFQIVERMPPSNLFKPGVPIVRYWDKAGSQGKGCYTAGVKIVALKDNKFLIIDVKRGQWGTDVRELMIKRTAQADGTDVHQWIEQEPGSGGKESAEATKKRLAGYVCRSEIPSGNKVYRADPYSVQVNEGNVWLLKGDWNKDFIEEHETFPYGTYKDQVDAAAAGFSKVAGGRIASSK